MSTIKIKQVKVELVLLLIKREYSMRWDFAR